MSNQEKRNRIMERKRRRETLVLEGITGKTVKDTLPNTAYPMTGEAEAMYFENAREFLKTSLAYNVMCCHQDIVDRIKV